MDIAPVPAWPSARSTPKPPYEGATRARPGVPLITRCYSILEVRTKAELDWVGRVPGAIEIEWFAYPGNLLNVHFIQTLKHSVSTESLLMFLRLLTATSKPVR